MVSELIVTAAGGRGKKGPATDIQNSQPMDGPGLGARFPHLYNGNEGKESASWVLSTPRSRSRSSLLEKSRGGAPSPVCTSHWDAEPRAGGCLDGDVFASVLRCQHSNVLNTV